LPTSKPQISVFIATSLDGFIARADGNLDWLDEANALLPSGEDCGFAKFFASVNAIVMGRKTYEKVLSFGGDWPYGDKPVLVLSSSPITFPTSLPASVTQQQGSPKELCALFSKLGFKRVYIDGATTIQRFINAGLVDDITLTQIPVLLGQGIPLFASLANDVHLQLESSKAYSFGFVQSVYQVPPLPIS